MTVVFRITYEPPRFDKNRIAAPVPGMLHFKTPYRQNATLRRAGLLLFLHCDFNGTDIESDVDRIKFRPNSAHFVLQRRCLAPADF